jgi:transcription antitermination factor NusG
VEEKKLEEKRNKQSLFKEVKLDEPKELEKYEVGDVVALTESQWIGILGLIDGPLYFNRISKWNQGKSPSKS